MNITGASMFLAMMQQYLKSIKSIKDPVSGVGYGISLCTVYLSPNCFSQSATIASISAIASSNESAYVPR